MAEFRPFDYGAAVAQGQQNALRGVSMRNAARDIQGQNALGQLAQQGVTGADKYNALNQMGRPDIVRQEQAKDLQMKAGQLQYIANASRRVYDQESFDQWKSQLAALGTKSIDEINAEFGMEYNTRLQNRLRQMRGESKGVISKLIQNFPGGYAQDIFQQDGQVIREGPLYDRWTPSQRGAGGKSFTPATINPYKLEMASDALGKIEGFNDAGSEDAQIAWINAFEKRLRAGLDTGKAYQEATAEIVKSSKNVQNPIWGAGKDYSPVQTWNDDLEKELQELEALENNNG